MGNFDILINDIGVLENQAYTAEFPKMNDYLLSDKEVVKKILKNKNPQLSDKEISYIVDNPDDIIKREEQEADAEDAKKRKTKKKETEQEKAKREAELQAAREKKRKEVKEKVQIYKDAYKSKLDALYTEAKNLLLEIKAAIFRLIKDIKDISKKFVTSTIQTFSSIPGITVTIAAPPWNIPSAISMAMVIVDVYIELLNRTKSVIPYLAPLRKLGFVTDKKNLSALSAILDVPVKILLALWTPIMEIGKLIQKLIEAILGILKNKKSSIFKKATAKLRTLGHIPHNPETIGVAGIDLKPYGDRKEYTIEGVRLHAYSEEDAEEVFDLLSTFRTNASDQTNPKSGNKVVAYKTNFPDELNSKLESLNDQLKGADIEFPDTTNADKSKENQNNGSYVFDVELPNGSKLYGISQDELDEIKSSYNVVMKQLDITETQIDTGQISAITQKLNKYNNKTTNLTLEPTFNNLESTLSANVVTDIGGQVENTDSGFISNKPITTAPGEASVFKFTAQSDSTAHLSWIKNANFNTQYHTQLIFLKAGTSIKRTGSDVKDPKTITSNSNFMGQSSNYWNDTAAKCVFKGQDNQVDISGLKPGAKYYALIIGYNIESFAANSGSVTSGTTISDI